MACVGEAVSDMPFLSAVVGSPQSKRRLWQRLYQPDQAKGGLFQRDPGQVTMLKSALPAPHTGQTQSSGTASQGVPGAMPLSGSHGIMS